VASVDEEKFWRSVLCVLGRLLLAYLGGVPDMQAAIGAGGSQDGLVMGRPLNLKGNSDMSHSFTDNRVGLI